MQQTNELGISSRVIDTSFLNKPTASWLKGGHEHPREVGTVHRSFYRSTSSCFHHGSSLCLLLVSVHIFQNVMTGSAGTKMEKLFVPRESRNNVYCQATLNSLSDYIWGWPTFSHFSISFTESIQEKISLPLCLITFCLLPWACLRQGTFWASSAKNHPPSR